MLGAPNTILGPALISAWVLGKFTLTLFMCEGEDCFPCSLESSDTWETGGPGQVQPQNT